MDEESNVIAPNNVEKWHDSACAIAFYAHFVVFLAAAGYSVMKGYYSVEDEALRLLKEIYVRVLLRQTSIAVIMSCILTAGVHLCIGPAAEFMMHLVSILVVISLAIISISIWWFSSAWLSAIIAGIFTAVCFFVYTVHIPDISVSAKILVVVNTSARRYPSLLGALLISTFITHLYAVIANLTIRGVELFFRSNVSMATSSPLLMFMVAFYWGLSIYLTIQVILGIFRTVVAGVFVQDYQRRPDDPIPTPVFRLLRRAFTTSFGSIVYGSTLIMPISYIRNIFMKITSLLRLTGKPVVRTAQRGLDFAARRFNYFAFNRVARGEQSYRKAAPQSWDIVTSSKVQSVMGDQYVGKFTLFTSILIGIIAATTDTAVRVLVEGYSLKDCSHSFFGSLLLGMVVPELCLSVLDAGTLSLFVSLAEYPGSLKPCNPNFYKAIAYRYPEVVDSQ